MENAACAIAMVGVVLVILDIEYVTSKNLKRTLRIANAVLTKFLLSLVVWRFIMERRILIRRNVLPPNISFIRMRKQLLQLALELGACAIVVPPGTTGSFEVREWKYYVDDGSCGAPFVENDVAIVETPVNPTLAPLSNTVWLVALTMATVGYGDIVPLTATGQALLVIGGMISGILLVAALFVTASTGAHPFNVSFGKTRLATTSAQKLECTSVEIYGYRHFGKSKNQV
ncbi:hypothetical protein ON010_g6457 [Phytophthora cinnamomi]|nr:hypothetical protein ON010_g6457 [Phytophthora cinnamomi]